MKLTNVTDPLVPASAKIAEISDISDPNQTGRSLFIQPGGSAIIADHIANSSVQIKTLIADGTLVKESGPDTIGIGAPLITAVGSYAWVSGDVANNAIGSHNVGIALPVGSIVVKSWYEILANFDSASSTATISLDANATGDLKGATLVSDASLSTLGIYDTSATGSGATMIKITTSIKQVKASVLLQAITIGSLRVYVQYIQSI